MIPRRSRLHPRDTARLLTLVGLLAAALPAGPRPPVVLAAAGARAAGPQAEAPGVVHRLVIDGAIHPASAELILKSIGEAETAGAEALLIVLDTPGGLLESTRLVVKGMLAAGVPVVVYVAPAGARAGSAGVFITLAAHVAAMAPGTNIGAAHPVGAGGRDISPGREPEPPGGGRRPGPGLPGGRPEGADRDGQEEESGDPGQERREPEGGDLERKVLNDAVAFIRSIAVRRGRNAEWAERAVRESASITAAEALRENVVDLVVATDAELLRELDGRVIETAAGPRTPRTAEAEVVEVEKGLRFAILDAIANPNVAFILMILGMYGLFFELANPGAIVPGVIGGISLLLALFAFQALPVNHVGLLLILLGIVLFLAEIKVVSHGILTIGGVVAFLLGATMLFETPEPALRVSWAVILPALVVTVAFFTFAMAAALRARRARPATGREGLVGATATVRVGLEPPAAGTPGETPEYRGKVFVHSELWNAVADRPLHAGERVEVVANEGLTLRVRPLRAPAAAVDVGAPHPERGRGPERDVGSGRPRAPGA